MTIQAGLASPVIDILHVRSFAEQLAGTARQPFTMTMQPLPGGLNSPALVKVTLTRDGGTFVVKHLCGNGLRELAVYQWLRASGLGPALPSLLGVQHFAPDQAYMYLDFVGGADPWPWREHSANVAVLRQLAMLHSLRARELDPAITAWDYEADLHHSAVQTLETFASGVSAGFAPGDRPMLRTLERTVAVLPAMRAALMTWHPPVLLHGDAHAGNAFVRSNSGGCQAVLLDWARARIGSPLEDVCSWLQSVGYWEWEVRRRHDTLLKCYLDERHLPPFLDSEFRELCWLAAACNAMSGALRYHLLVSCDAARPAEARFQAAAAAKDSLRVLRRADICWRS